MNLFAQLRRRPTAYGSKFMLRLFRKYLDVEVARSLPWGQYHPRLHIRAKWTKDGWLVYADWRDVLHLRLQYHNHALMPKEQP